MLSEEHSRVLVGMVAIRDHEHIPGTVRQGRERLVKIHLVSLLPLHRAQGGGRAGLPGCGKPAE